MEEKGREIHPLKRIVQKHPLLLYSAGISEEAYKMIINGEVKTPEDLIDFVAMYASTSPLKLRDEIRRWEEKYGVKDSLIF